MGVRRKKTHHPVLSARPDDRGRITLGSLAKDVSRYDVFLDELSGELLLRPFREIASHEAWLFQNPTARALVAKGLKAAQEGKLVDVDLTRSSWIDEIEDDE